MSQRDQKRWDEKWTYLDSGPFDPHPLLLSNHKFLSGGVALDLACGRGQNALWLARHGYLTLGVDISLVALKLATEEAKESALSDRVQFVQVDLDCWDSSPHIFDLICVFRFLNRRLFPVIRNSLKPGGCLFYNTRHVGLLRQNPEATRDYLLESGELIAAFGDWFIIHYRDDDKNAELVARKPD